MMFKQSFPKSALIAISLGNILEFYDFALYGLFVPVIAPLYFPDDNISVSYIITFMIFAVSFLGRAIGAILFGYIADKSGRIYALSYSLIMMSLSTLVIAILPTYFQIGFLAPIILIICRILQGLSMGGEYSTSLILLSELIENKSKYKILIMSIAVASTVSGWILGSLATYLCTIFSLNNNSWRFAYILGGLIGIIGFYLRKSIKENSNILILIEKNANNKLPLYIFKKEPLKIIAIIGIAAYIGILFYGQFILQNTYLPLAFGISKQFSSLATTIGLGTYMCFLPIMGLISDKIGPIKVMIFTAFVAIIFSYPSYYLFGTKLNHYIILVEIISGLLLASYMAPASFVMTNCFKPNVRCTIVSFSYNLGGLIFGSTTPVISIFIYQQTLIPTLPFVCLVFGSVFGLISSIILGYYANHHKEF